MDDKKKANIAYNVLTWGPCVVKMKMTDDFHKILIKESEAAKEVLPEPLLKLWKEYSEKESHEAKYLSLLDKTDMALQAVLYQSQANTDEFIASFYRALEEYKQEFKDIPQVSFKEDTSITKGGCIIDTSYGSIRATLEEEFEELVKHLNKEQDALTEKKENGA